MTKLYVCGGRLRSTIFKKLEEWQSCDLARVIELDPANNESCTRAEYASPPEACADELRVVSSSLRDCISFFDLRSFPLVAGCFPLADGTSPLNVF